MSQRDTQSVKLPTVGTQRKYWDDWNLQHRQNAGLKDQPWDARVRGAVVLELLNSLGITSPRILEIGCSTGWMCRELSHYGSVTGIDLAGEVIREARATVPEVRFFAGDILEMDLGVGQFDVVVSLETIAHVKDKDAFCDAIYSILSDRGYLILTTQNRTVWERTSWLEIPEEIIQEFMNMRELKKLLHSKFRILRSQTAILEGDMGFLKILNSRIWMLPFRFMLKEWRVNRIKERLGFGNTLIVLAQKR